MVMTKGGVPSPVANAKMVLDFGLYHSMYSKGAIDCASTILFYKIAGAIDYAILTGNFSYDVDIIFKATPAMAVGSVIHGGKGSGQCTRQAIKMCRFLVALLELRA